MRPLLLGVLAAACLGACGGDDGDEESGSTTRTQTSVDTRPGSDFVATVDSLCNETRPELARIQKQLVQARDAARSGRAGLPATFNTFATLLTRAESAAERFSEQFRAIPGPSSERAFRKRVMASVEAGLKNVRAQISAARAQNSLKLRELSVEGTTIDSERRGLFAGHGGFRSCAQGATG